jgi:type I restriction enzyme, S subunit
MSSKKKIAATKDNRSPALVPKLRFPEFRAADGWEEIPIGEKVDLLSGYPFDGPDITQDYSGIRLLRGINITEGRIRHSTEIDRFYTGAVEGLEKFRVRVNDLVIGMDGSKVGKNSALVTKEDEDALLIQRVARLRASNSTLIKFIFHQINSTTFHTYVDKINTSSGIPHISAQQIKDFAIGFPSPDEQQKIAECLSSVDDLMAAQSRKVNALRTHKKGLMQQLFPRRGETQPRLRFPEFQNAGEWEYGELSPKTSKVGSGITPTGGDKNYKQAGRPFVRSQNVGWGILLLDDVAYIDEATHASFDSTEIKVSDVLLNITGASIGRSAVADERIARGNVNQHVCIIRVKPDELAPYFLNQFLISQRGQKQIDSFQAGGNRQGLNFAQIRSFVIPLPPKLPEQQRIADCLTSLDDLIAVQTQLLDALKTHKKGLMQQLFPSPEESL